MMHDLHIIRDGHPFTPLELVMKLGRPTAAVIIGEQIEALIATLDHIDGDPDREPASWNERPNQARWPTARALLMAEDAEEDDGDSCVTDGPHDKAEQGDDEVGHRVAPRCRYGSDQSRGPLNIYALCEGPLR